MELFELDKVEILLDNHQINYQNGQTISGEVKIKSNAELELSKLTIVLRSMSEVKWVDNCCANYCCAGHVYRDDQQYLNVVFEIPNNSMRS